MYAGSSQRATSCFFCATSAFWLATSCCCWAICSCCWMSVRSDGASTTTKSTMIASMSRLNPEKWIERYQGCAGVLPSGIATGTRRTRGFWLGTVRR